MTIEYFNNWCLDEILRTFAKVNGGRVEVLFQDPPENYASAVALLVKEGYLKEDKYGFEITFKGKAFIQQGGFVGEYRRKRTLFYCTIVAAVTGVLGLIISIVALLR